MAERHSAAPHVGVVVPAETTPVISCSSRKAARREGMAKQSHWPYFGSVALFMLVLGWASPAWAAGNCGAECRVPFEIAAFGKQTESDGPCPQATCTAGDTCTCLTFDTNAEELRSKLGTGTFTAALTLDHTAATPNGSGGTCTPFSGTASLQLMAKGPPATGTGIASVSANFSIPGGQACVTADGHRGGSGFAVASQGGSIQTGGGGNAAITAAADTVEWNGGPSHSLPDRPDSRASGEMEAVAGVTLNGVLFTHTASTIPETP
jgi:hypothetical protein